MKVEFLTLLKLAHSPLAAALSSEHAGIFLNSSLLSLWEKIYRWKFLAITDGQALFTAFIKSTLIGRILYSLPFGWYGGFQGSVSDDFVCEVLSRLKKGRFLEERIVQFKDGLSLGLIERYRRRELSTYLLDLSTPPDYSTNTVRNLKKAETHSLRVKRFTGENLRRFLDLKIEHERRTGERRKVMFAFYQELFSLSLRPDAGIEIYAVFTEAELIGCQLYFVNPASMFYFDGFSSREALEKCANFLLTDHVIRAAQQRGMKSLNFGSSPAGDVGLERFKSGWGVKSAIYSEYYRASAFKRAVDRWRGRR